MATNGHPFTPSVEDYKKHATYGNRPCFNKTYLYQILIFFSKDPHRWSTALEADAELKAAQSMIHHTRPLTSTPTKKSHSFTYGSRSFIRFKNQLDSSLETLFHNSKWSSFLSEWPTWSTSVDKSMTKSELKDSSPVCIDQANAGQSSIHH